MRVHVLIALCLASLAFTACEKHDIVRPNGYGNYAEIPANVQNMIPDNAFPLAKRFAHDCAVKEDLASCNYLGWMLSVGMEPPVQFADQTDPNVTDSIDLNNVVEYDAVPKDTKDANALFRAACEAGWSSACVSLVRQGVAKKPGKLLADACAQGAADACEMLGDAANDGSIPGMSKEEIIRKLKDACNNHKLYACNAQAKADDGIGQNTSAGGVERGGELVTPILDIQTSGDKTTVIIYTDNEIDANGITSRAKKAFGDDATITVKPAQGDIRESWAEITPALLSIAGGVPNDAHLTLDSRTITLNTIIENAEERTAVQAALTRLAGTNYGVQATLSGATEAQ